jgi:3-dehydroquinate dehydratase II
MKIAIINGPNLNMLGTREPEIYGNSSFEAYLEKLQQKFIEIEFKYFQSNIEGEIVTAIQQLGFECNGIIINPAAYSHTSIAIADALIAINAPVIEVHISNIFVREEYRHHSFVSSKARAVITGAGLQGYELALLHLKSLWT